MRSYSVVHGIGSSNSTCYPYIVLNPKDYKGELHEARHALVSADVQCTTVAHVRADDRVSKGSCWLFGFVYPRADAGPLAAVTVSTALHIHRAVLCELALEIDTRTLTHIHRHKATEWLQGMLTHDSIKAVLMYTVVSRNMCFALGVLTVRVVAFEPAGVPDDTYEHCVRIVDSTDLRLTPSIAARPNVLTQLPGLREFVDSVVCGQRNAIDYILSQLESVEAVHNATSAGLLLHGASGCGKSLTCRAISEHLGLATRVVQCLSLPKDERGEAEDFIRSVFRDCLYGWTKVLILENLDSCCGAEERARSLSHIACTAAIAYGLDQLCESDVRCLVIGTTSTVAQVHGSLTRPGRLGVHIQYDLPSQCERELFLHSIICSSSRSGRQYYTQQWTEKNCCQACTDRQKASIGALSQRSQGLSYAELQLLCTMSSCSLPDTGLLGRLSAASAHGVIISATSLSLLPPLYGCEKELQILKERISLPLEPGLRDAYRRLRVRSAPGTHLKSPHWR
jgi:hypothetical protein